jgi:hypothetical protein
MEVPTALATPGKRFGLREGSCVISLVPLGLFHQQLIFLFLSTRRTKATHWALR